MQLTAASSSSLRAQYYNQLAREAAESGAEMAVNCLRNNNMISSWNGKSLKPETDCYGSEVSGQDGYLMNYGNVRTRFLVKSPENGNTEMQQLEAVGYVELLRSSDGAVTKTYTFSQRVSTGSQTITNSITFGYAGVHNGPDRVFFTTIDSAGTVRSVGANHYGQLGNGRGSNGEVSPVTFNMPSRAAAAYTNFVSVGYTLFVRDYSGNIYGSGSNEDGRLGNGSTSAISHTPTKYILPAGVRGLYASSGNATFVLGDDNNVYAAGKCIYGLLGTGDYGNNATYTSSCTNRSQPKRVALPSPNAADLNTIPTSKMAQDRANAYVVMAGGAVYGWGLNDFFQLGRVDMKNTSTPVRVGDFGAPGKPKATNVAFNGDTLYILTDGGEVYSAGLTTKGETGQNFIEIVSWNGDKCFDDQGYQHTTIRLYDCNGTKAQTFEFINYDSPTKGAIRVSGVMKCIDRRGGNTDTLQIFNCNGSAAQRFELIDHSGGNHATAAFRLVGTNKCIINPSGDTLALGSCSSAFRFRLQSSKLTKVRIPEKVVQMSTDEMFVSFRTESGKVYSVGDNTNGVMGDPTGGNTIYNTSPRQFKLPDRVKAVDISSSAQALETGNLFVVGDNGKVYGAGTNEEGQLGDGTRTSRSAPAEMQTFGQASDAPKARSVMSGGATTVIFTQNNQVYTVGSNVYGQLGTGSATPLFSTTPVLGKYTNQPIVDRMVF